MNVCACKILTNNSINLTFKRRIIDSHTHIGSLNGKTYTKSHLDIFVKSKLPNNDVIEKMYVSNLDVLTSKHSELEGNLILLKNFMNSDKFELFLACSPKNGDIINIKQLLNKFPNKFIGFKFHPTLQNLNLSSEKYKPYLELANKNRIPCLFHSAVSIIDGKINDNLQDISDPKQIYQIAKKYKETPIVMAHLGAGWQESHDKTIDILIESIKKGDANLYADISWVDIGLEHNGIFDKNSHRTKEHIIKAIKRLKGIGDKNWKFGDQSYRLMFGSDAPIDRFSNSNYGLQEYITFIEDIKFAIKNDKDLNCDAEKIIDDLFYKNAKKLYNKKIDLKVNNRNIIKNFIFITSFILSLFLIINTTYKQSLIKRGIV